MRRSVDVELPSMNSECSRSDKIDGIRMRSENSIEKVTLDDDRMQENDRC